MRFTEQADQSGTRASMGYVMNVNLASKRWLIAQQSLDPRAFDAMRILPVRLPGPETRMGARTAGLSRKNLDIGQACTVLNMQEAQRLSHRAHTSGDSLRPFRCLGR